MIRIPMEASDEICILAEPPDEIRILIQSTDEAF